MGAAQMLTGTLTPSTLQMVMQRLVSGLPVLILQAMAQDSPQMLAWNTSLHGLPIATSRGKPVIRSAALLKEVIRQLVSTVNTPSAILSRITACCMEALALRKT